MDRQHTGPLSELIARECAWLTPDKDLEFGFKGH
jgi:hypothetical protein